jgi:hypothetical protein
MIEGLKVDPVRNRIFSTVTQYVKTGSFKPRREDWRKKMAGMGSPTVSDDARQEQQQEEDGMSGGAVHNPLHAGEGTETGNRDVASRTGAATNTKTRKVKGGVASTPQLPGRSGEALQPIPREKRIVRSGFWEEDTGAEFVV